MRNARESINPVNELGLIPILGLLAVWCTGIVYGARRVLGTERIARAMPLVRLLAFGWMLFALWHAGRPA